MNLVNKLKEILKHNHVFLSGGAGVGKSYLTNELKKDYKQSAKEIAVLGSTAISAFNVGGFTLHSFFAFGICTNLNELMALDKKQKEKLKKLRKILQKLELIIIDEISMVSASVFEMIDFRLKDADFKGKMLVVGDFCQLPPIQNAKQEKNHLFSRAYYAFSSSAWQNFNFVNILLHLPKRTQNEEFYTHLLALRESKLDEKQACYFEQFIIKTQDYERLDDDFTLLCGINKKVDCINESKLSKLEGKLYTFKARVQKFDQSLDDKSIERWIKGLSVLDELKLKVGAKIIFCANNWELNYYNGEQGLVDDIFEEDGEIFIQILKSNGVHITLEPFAFTLEDLFADDLEDHVRAKLYQFPIKLAYAITIHKSQGMSIQKLICDIDHIFENGQLYVAISRAIDPKTLKILYSRTQNFKEYFLHSAKIDEEVLEFYKKNEFLYLEDLDKI
ncbi:helicase [Campylobacter sp. MIT 99-7217]|uniref:ATP-dependent DNA helicase n=1 Tax=Campylobacter sp. MIT 99-7217 TaxID=535091 RepID=UPI00115A158B|nr:AAA family ATPase [Campylobacter sp. MIT 99-7217]TQR31868.1 helicase [Campylobacter sp. MIT 99-7217]